MKVSKDQHLQAERKCLNAAATEWSVKRDQTPGANLRISHIHVLLTSLGQHVPLKINVGFAKVWRKIFFSGEDGVFHMKEFRTTLIYIYIFLSFNICLLVSENVKSALGTCIESFASVMFLFQNWSAVSLGKLWILHPLKVTWHLPTYQEAFQKKNITFHPPIPNIQMLC